MFWESSIDRTGGNSIIQNMADILGGQDGAGLDKTPNQLFYPDSPYDNILKSASKSGAPATTTSRPGSSHMSSSTISSESSLSTPPANSSCTVGSAFYEYKDGGVCLCSLDIDGNPVGWDPSSTCYNKSCTGTSECGENEACMDVDTCGSRCAPVVDGCENNPRATEIVISPVQTSTLT